MNVEQDQPRKITSSYLQTNTAYIQNIHINKITNIKKINILQPDPDRMSIYRG